jgi:hypothetical protein
MAIAKEADMTRVLPSTTEYQTRQATDVRRNWTSLSRDLDKHGTVEIRSNSHVVAYMLSPDVHTALLEAASATAFTHAEKIAALNAKFDAHLASLKAPGLTDKLVKVLNNDGLPKTKRKAGSSF